MSLKESQHYQDEMQIPQHGGDSRLLVMILHPSPPPASLPPATAWSVCSLPRTVNPGILTGKQGGDLDFISPNKRLSAMPHTQAIASLAATPRPCNCLTRGLAVGQILNAGCYLTDPALWLFRLEGALVTHQMIRLE